MVGIQPDYLLPQFLGTNKNVKENTMQHEEVLASEIQAFIDAFRTVGNGEIAEETSRNLKKCVKATMLHGKKSTLSIKLDISQIADDQIAMVGVVSSKVPETQIKTGFFVNDRTFMPSRNRPKQQILPGT